VWDWWLVLPWPAHLAVLVLLAALYAMLPWSEWVLLLLGVAAVLFYVHPRWALIGAVGSIPFFYAAKPLFAAGRPMSGLQMPPSETLLYLYVLVTAARYVGARRWPRLTGGWTPLDVVWGMWVAWGAGSLAVAPDLALAWHEWRLCILDPALLYMTLRVTDGKPGAGVSATRPFLSVWLFSGAVVSLVGVVQWVTGAPVPAGSVGRVTGVYYSPNHLALYLDRIWPVVMSVALCADLTVGRRRRARAMALLIGAALYLTYSRGTWLLAIPVALMPLGWCYRRRLRRWGTIGVLAALLLAASNVLYGRLASDAGLLDEVRIPVWQSTWHMIRDHPWWGVGLDGYRFAYQRYMQVAAWTEPLLHHPHNAWLDAAVRLGLPGLVLYGTLVALCIHTAARWTRAARGIERAMALGCMAGLLAGVAHGLVDSGYFLADLAWSLALVAGAAQAGPARPHVDEKVGV
jgi:O-antigen ligase